MCSNWRTRQLRSILRVKTICTSAGQRFLVWLSMLTAYLASCQIHGLSITKPCQMPFWRVIRTKACKSSRKDGVRHVFLMVTQIVAIPASRNSRFTLFPFLVFLDRLSLFRAISISRYFSIALSLFLHRAILPSRL